MTSGRVLLPEEKERAALPALRAGVGTQGGSLPAEAPLNTLEELAGLAGARAVRDGDWVLLATDKTGEPKWSQQASAFYVALAPWVSQGEVRLTGEDGTRWSYSYSPAGVAQDGVNGWDGSAQPTVLPPDAAPPVATPGGTPPAGMPESPEAGTPEATPPVEPPHVEPPHVARPAPEPPSFQVPPPDPGRSQWPPSSSAPPPASTDPFWSTDTPTPRSSGRAFGMAVLLIAGVFCIIMVAMLAAGIVG